MGFSIWQLLILLAIIVLLFGTKRLRGMGSDIGSAVKGFKKSVADDDDKPGDKPDSNGDKLDDKSTRDDKQDR